MADSRPIDDESIAQLVALLKSGKKIEAIKLYRQLAGVDLKEAKDAVEALAEKHGFPVSRGKGCLGMVALVFLLIVYVILSQHGT